MPSLAHLWSAGGDRFERPGRWLTSHFRGEVCGEFSEASELCAQLQLRAIEKDREDGLGRAGIIDDLLGKEDLAVVVSMLQSCPVIFL